MVMELQGQGLSEEQIRAQEASIRANAHESTLRGLKEFFILAKIADAEDIKVEDEDFENEIEADRRREPTRAPGGFVPGSRRRGWSTPSRPRSSSARPWIGSSSTSSSRRSRSDQEPEVETHDRDARPDAAVDAPDRGTTRPEADSGESAAS